MKVYKMIDNEDILNELRRRREKSNEGHQGMINQRMINIELNMSRIKNKIVIISGKGGVGKTTVAVNLAICLASYGLRVGILDLDITGPNVTKMLGIKEGTRFRVATEAHKFYPVEGPFNLKVVSMAFFLKDSDTPVIWRGPMKMGAVRQFLGDAIWGDLDYLIVDLPPGTSDEPLDILQLIPDENVVVVSTPQEVAVMDARKAIAMALTLKRKVLGIIENMSGFQCPHCDKHIDPNPPRGGENAAKDFNIAFLGKIPFELEITQQCDQGVPFVVKCPNSTAAKEFKILVKKIRDNIEGRNLIL
jgi:Mrp family chromosome partitioning ATPase